MFQIFPLVMNPHAGRPLKKKTPGLLAALGMLATLFLTSVAFADPVASWQFDASNGKTVADPSVRGNDRTAQGDAGWGPGLVGAHDLSLPGKPEALWMSPKQ